MPYGRPMKGASRRVPTTVHIPTGTLDIIDNYIDDREKDVGSTRTSDPLRGDHARSGTHQ